MRRGGQFLLEHDAGRMSRVGVGEVQCAGDLSISCEFMRDSESHVEMSLRYDMAHQTWRHTFQARKLSEPEIETLLIRAGFDEIEWLGNLRRWARAAIL